MGELWTTVQGMLEVLNNAVRNVKATVTGAPADPYVEKARGKVVLITGGTSGIGAVTAQKLASHGANVIITGRSEERAAAVAHQLQQTIPRTFNRPGQIASMAVDLASLKSVKAFWESVKHKRVDVLVCNAGLMCPLERTLTEDGCEAQFQTNHLGHFVLAARMAGHHLEEWVCGRRTWPLRIVLVSSLAHNAGRLQFNDLQAAAAYKPFASYAQSKLANVMTAMELAQRVRTHPGNAVIRSGHGAVSATCIHPGLVDTPLARGYFLNDWIHPSLRLVARPVVKMLLPAMLLRPELSVQGMVKACLASEDEVHAAYFEGIHQRPPSQRVWNIDDRQRLWRASCELAAIADPLPLPLTP